jgi:hypothetical protein
MYRIFVESPGGKRPFGRPRLGWEDYIKMELRGIWFQNVD